MTGNKKKLVPIALMSIAAFAVAQAGVVAPLISSAGNNPVSNPIVSSGESAPLKTLIVTPTDRISGCNIGLKYAAISKKYWCGDYVVDPDIAIINASAPTTQILACASYVNQYGIPGNYTLGNFTRVVETNIYNPTYNTVISVNISGCSAPVVQTGQYCSGYTLIYTYSDGTQISQGGNNPACGYVPTCTALGYGGQITAPVGGYLPAAPSGKGTDWYSVQMASSSGPDKHWWACPY